MTEAPPYEFCTVIPDIQHGSGTNKEIRCVQAMGRNIYLGCSDGSLLRYILEEPTNGPAEYRHYSEYTLPSKTPIESIQLAPSASKAIVLSNDHLFFFALPTLEPISAEILRPMKNALNFVINETPGTNETVGLGVIKRTSISFWELGNKLHHLKELNVTALAARRAGPTLCIADTDRYSIINLRNSDLIPVHPISLVETWKILPQIEVSKSDEYLLVVCTGASDDFSQVYSMGLFINGRGDPTQAPLEFSSVPSSVCIDGEMVISLHNDTHSSQSTPTIEVRMINSQSLHQSLSPPSSKTHGDIRLLSYARSGVSIPLNSRREKLHLKPRALFEKQIVGRNGSKSVGKADSQEPTGSGPTPPPTPKPPRPSHEHSRSQSRGNGSIDKTPGSNQASTLPIAQVLATTAHSVYALLPSTILTQIEGLLNDGQVKEASTLLAQAQVKHAKDENLVADFRYLNLLIGIYYLHQASFEDAGDALFRGEMDPRWLMGLWEEWRDLVIRSSSGAPVMMETFAGLESYLDSLQEISIKQIIANYSPHLKPSTAQSSAGQELQITLEWSARTMLEKYLRKFRNRRRFVAESAGGVYANQEVNRAVDTVSVMLYAESNNTEELQELIALLDDSTYIVPDDVRDSLAKNGRAALLAKMYQRRGDTAALLDLYIQLAEGTIIDRSVSDPVREVTALLRSSREPELVRKHVVWLLRRDPDSGIKLLIAIQSQKPLSSSEDINLLSEVTSVNAGAGLRFLEYLVLQKQTKDPALHTQLATSYMTAVIKELKDPQWLERERAILKSYLGSDQHHSTPFLSYLAFEAVASDYKTTRLKLLLLLQGSDLYSLEELRRELREQGSNVGPVLALEKSILDSKFEDHKSALSIIVNELQDFTTAEAYCSLGGRVITPKIAALIGDTLHLREWANFILLPDLPSGLSPHGYSGRIPRQGSNSSLSAKKQPVQEDENKAAKLTRMLLEVYMGAGERKALEASQLLNAQAINFEAEEIVPLMPSSWSLSLVSSFLSRSFRRSLHQEYEGQILKQLSAGENLQTSEYALAAFASAGAMIEESGGDVEEVNGSSDSEADSQGEVNMPTLDLSDAKELGSKIKEKLSGTNTLTPDRPPTISKE